MSSLDARLTSLVSDLSLSVRIIPNEWPNSLSMVRSYDWQGLWAAGEFLCRVVEHVGLDLCNGIDCFGGRTTDCPGAILRSPTIPRAGG